MDIASITELAPPVLLLAALNVIGIAIKKSTIPNQFIPWFMIALGGVFYPFIAEKTGPMIQAHHPTAHAILVGILIGGAATGVYEASRALRTDQNDSKSPTP